MELRNKSKNTINITLKKVYEEYGRTLIFKKGEIKNIYNDILKEPEINKYIKKGILVEVIRVDKKDIFGPVIGTIENKESDKKKSRKNKPVEEA